MSVAPEQAASAPDMERAALALARAGWKCFPCRLDKKPHIKAWPKRATTDPAQISAWWRKWPGASIGCPCGPDGNGLWVLDVDLPAGPESLTVLKAEHGPLPSTLQQQTGSGGAQYFFAWPEGLEIKNSAGKLGPGLDLRGRGGYCIVPPSPHPSGGRYRWTSPKGTLPAQAPPWLLALVASQPEPNAPRSKPKPPRAQASGSSSTAYGRSALESEAGRVALAPQGQRNHALNAAAFALGQLVGGGQLARSEAEDALVRAAVRSGLPEAEARATVASGLDAGQREPRKPERNIHMRGHAPQGIQPGQPFNPRGLFVGCFCPNCLLRLPGLSSTAKILWGRLAQYAASSGTAWPSQSALGRELGLTARHIRRALVELESQGFIVRQPPSPAARGRQATTRYFMTWHTCFEPEAEDLGTNLSLA